MGNLFRRVARALWNNALVSAILVFISLLVALQLRLLAILPKEGERRTRAGWFRACARGLAIVGVIFVVQEVIAKIYPKNTHLFTWHMGVCILVLAAAATLEIIGRDMQSQEPALDAMRCRGCGYNLMGNVSGFARSVANPLKHCSPTTLTKLH